VARKWVYIRLITFRPRRLQEFQKAKPRLPACLLQTAAVPPPAPSLMFFLVAWHYGSRGMPDSAIATYVPLRLGSYASRCFFCAPNRSTPPFRRRGARQVVSFSCFKCPVIKNFRFCLSVCNPPPVSSRWTVSHVPRWHCAHGFLGGREPFGDRRSRFHFRSARGIILRKRIAIPSHQKKNRLRSHGPTHSCAS